MNTQLVYINIYSGVRWLVALTRVRGVGLHSAAKDIYEIPFVSVHR